jgi:hypothetical protein
MTVQPYSATAQVKSLAGTAAAPGITFTGDIDTGLFSPGANQVAVTTGGVQRLLIGADGSITPSGSFLFPAGTAASPSVSFTGDPNTGIFSPGADQLSVATNGTERLRINATGQVGAVSLGTAAAPAYTFTGDPNTGIYSPGADQVAVATNGTGRLFINSAGDVGIGTSSPTYRLQIKGPDNDSGTILRLSSNNEAASLGVTYNSILSSGVIRFYTGGIDAATSSERLRITSEGLVGIGTSSPGELLDVAGSIRQTGNTAGTTNTVGLIDFYNANNTTTIARVNVRTDGAANSGSYRISTANAGTLNEVVRITSGGRVGIGTTSPGKAVDIQVAPASSADAGLRVTDGTRNVFIAVTGSTFSYKGVGANETMLYGSGGPLNLLADSTFIKFCANASEAARIDGSGRLLVGTSTSNNVILEGRLQVAGTGVNAFATISRWDSANPGLIFGASDGGSVGTHSLVANGRNLGEIAFAGSDGTNFTKAAFIAAFVDGTPGANDMPGRLVFSTTADGASSPTERMRIRNDGEVLINKTSSFETVHSLGVFKANNPLGVGTDAGSGQEAVRFYNGATAVGTIATTTSTTAYNTSSDYRLKENVVDLDGAIDRLKLLPVHRFNFIADPDTVVDGFIAHEVQTIVPEAITGEKDAVDEDGNPVYQGIDQSKLVPLLTAALQEAVAKIESLEARLTTAGL